MKNNLNLMPEIKFQYEPESFSGALPIPFGIPKCGFSIKPFLDASG